MSGQPPAAAIHAYRAGIWKKGSLGMARKKKTRQKPPFPAKNRQKPPL